LNPYNPLHITGGTSNGSAAAMAACFATLAVGTDTSASVLYPSACCGVTGMLGTQGMVSRAGIIPNGATMDRAGSMGRSVYDVTALFSAMAGWDAEDLITFRSMGRFPQSDWSKELQVADLAGRRLGVLREMIYDGPVHAEGRAIFEQALGDLRKGGAVV
jgi:amidase